MPSALGRLAYRALYGRFADYRDQLGLARGLDLHSLRRSYISHLHQRGYDTAFISAQVGHKWAATTALLDTTDRPQRTHEVS